MENSNLNFTLVERMLKLVKEEKGTIVDPTYYKSVIESMRYLTTNKLDIIFGVGSLNRYMEKPYDCHLQVAKRILHYIKDTLTDGIFYCHIPNPRI